MISHKNQKVLLGPEDFTPTQESFNVIGVFNPGATRYKDDIILLVRIAQATKQEFPKWLYSPRSIKNRNESIEYNVDKLEIDPLNGSADPRKPLLKNGQRRLAFISHIEIVRLSNDGYTIKEIIRHKELFGNNEFEEFGIEDPRITKIDNTFYITYVGVSSTMGVATYLMSTKDFKSFQRYGVIFPCENKDVVIYPEKINGKFFCMHRPVGRINISKLQILCASSPDLICWGNHTKLIGCTDKYEWCSQRIGAGTPPIKTNQGWLSLFHGVRKRFPQDQTGEYTSGALLTDLSNPSKLISFTKTPFFRPKEDFEKYGYIDDVVFPTGWVIDNQDKDIVHVYYGATDTYVAVKSFSIKEILSEILQ